jgi:hypothetical protein
VVNKLEDVFVGGLWGSSSVLEVRWVGRFQRDISGPLKAGVWRIGLGTYINKSGAPIFVVVTKCFIKVCMSLHQGVFIPFSRSGYGKDICCSNSHISWCLAQAQLLVFLGWRWILFIAVFNIMGCS